MMVDSDTIYVKILTSFDDSFFGHLERLVDTPTELIYLDDLILASSTVRFAHNDLKNVIFGNTTLDIFLREAIYNDGYKHEYDEFIDFVKNVSKKVNLALGLLGFDSISQISDENELVRFCNMLKLI